MAKQVKENQCDKILKRLKGGGWVPLPELVILAAQYNNKIFRLRKGGHNIVNRSEWKNGVRHSWFKLEDSSAALGK